MVRLGKVLVLAGALILIGAVAWWYAFFEQFLGRDVKQASECFYYTSDTCSLAGIVGYVGEIPTYSPVPFWLSIAVMVIGVIVLTAAPMKA